MFKSTILGCLVGLLFSMGSSHLPAQSIPSLTLSTEKSALVANEMGNFTLTITNSDSVALTDVVVDFTEQNEFDLIDSTINLSSGTYDAGWVIDELAAGASETFRFLASSSGYARFIAEVVSPGSDILVGRCFSSNCYPDDNFKCYYESCNLEADEVIYPQEFAAVEITNIECFPTGDIGCGRNYNITFSNPSNTNSAPLNLFMRAFFGEALYQQTGTTFPIPSIAANDSLMLNIDFGDCFDDQPFMTVQNLQIGLVASTAISLFANGRQTAPTSAFVDLRNVSRCSYNNTTDISLVVNSDGRLNDDNTASYQILVINNGDETAESLQLTYGRNIVGGSGEIIQYTASSDYEMGSFSEDEASRNNGLDYDKYWNIQNLPPGDTAILNALVSVDSFINELNTGILINENSFLTDPNPDDNATSITFRRGSAEAIDLALSVTTNRPDIAQYESGTFTYTLTNDSDVAATGVAVEFYYEDRVVPVGGAEVLTGTGSYATTTDLVINEKTGRWENIAVAANDSTTLQIDLFSLTENLSFCAAVVSADQDDSDSDPTTGCATAEDDVAIFTAVPPYIDLELTVDLESADFIAPGTQQITLSLFNGSPSAATGVEVAVDLDETLVGVFDTFYITSGSSIYSLAAEQWTLAELPAYHSAQLVFYVTPTAANFDVFAEVTAADQIDEDSTPGNGSCCTTNEDDEAVLNATIPLVPDEIELHQRKIKSVAVYPNPTRDQLRLGNYRVVDYEIVDLFGRIMQHGTTDSGAIDVQRLPNGTYFLQFRDEQMMSTRFVKM